MPKNNIEALAARSGKSKSDIEKFWDKAKELAKKKFKEADKQFYPYVMGIVKNMAGIKEMKLAERILSDISEASPTSPFKLYSTIKDRIKYIEDYKKLVDKGSKDLHKEMAPVIKKGQEEIKYLNKILKEYNSKFVD